MTPALHAARWWHPAERGKLLCTLCPRYCLIGEGQAGFCYVRQNRGGQLVSAGYGRSTGFAVDPIEKKPLNHFLPGARVLSFGTAGCNLGCKFCQNWDISKAKIDQHASETATPEEVVELALRTGCQGIAYTYNDPVIWAEFAIDVARAARAAGLVNVFVTAGYVTPEARPEVFEHMDATNVDLKGFTEEFYHRITFGHLEAVLDTLVWLRRESAVWTEITTLLIPGLNDGDEEIGRECDWILEHLGPDVPLHFTAFHRDPRPCPRDRPCRRPPLRLRRQRARRRGADDVVPRLRRGAHRARLARDRTVSDGRRSLPRLRDGNPGALPSRVARGEGAAHRRREVRGVAGVRPHASAASAGTCTRCSGAACSSAYATRSASASAPAGAMIWIATGSPPLVPAGSGTDGMPARFAAPQ